MLTAVPPDLFTVLEAFRPEVWFETFPVLEGVLSRLPLEWFTAFPDLEGVLSRLPLDWFTALPVLPGAVELLPGA